MNNHNQQEERNMYELLDVAKAFIEPCIKHDSVLCDFTMEKHRWRWREKSASRRRR